MLRRHIPVFLRSRFFTRAYSDLLNSSHFHAFQRENEALKFHSTLFNQTTPQDLASLKDVTTMMNIYSTLHQNDAVSSDALRNIGKALSRTAKDCSIVLKKLPKKEKSKIKSQISRQLVAYCDEIAQHMVNGSIGYDLQTVGLLLSTYEVLAPEKGVAFYLESNATDATGSVIPCMVKANAPLSVIESAFENTPTKTERLRANMAWAYLMRDEPEKAVEMRDTIVDPVPSVQEFLLGAFVGDAPVELARETFNNAQIPPHQSAMIRFLPKAWAENPSVDDQLDLFRRYVELSRGLPESTFKPVTWCVISTVLSAHKTFDEAALKDLVKLTSSYQQFPQQRIFLNTLLTHASRLWPGNQDVILPIWKSYDLDSLDEVTCRVLLNSLYQLELDKKAELVRALWEKRLALQTPLDQYDWLALGKADMDFARDLWIENGMPAQKNLWRYFR